MNSFTADEKVENNLSGAGHLPLYPVDQPLQVGDLPVDGAQVQVHAQLLSVCHGCTQEVWNN